MGRVTTRVRRTRLDVDTGGRVDRTDTVAVEEPLEIRVGDEPLTTTMRTPGDDFDLAIGHLLTEAMLHSAAEVGTLMHCTDLDEDGSPTFNVVDVTLAPGAVLHRPARERTETISSACGVCGSATIDAVRTSSRYAVAEDAVVVSRRGAGRAARGPARPAAGVRPHRRGARGGAGDPGRRAARRPRGRRPAQRRRQGRGRPLARDRELPFSGTVLVVSARASFEIVQKASVAGIPVVVAVGAASSLAVELATQGRHHPRRVRATPAPVGLQPPRPAARRGVTARYRRVASAELGERRRWGERWARARSPVRDRHRRKDDRVASREDVGPILNGIPTHLPDIDPDETEEWLESLDGLIDGSRPDRARATCMLQHAASARGPSRWACRRCTTTDYVNTIAPENEP